MQDCLVEQVGEAGQVDAPPGVEGQLLADVAPGLGVAKVAHHVDQRAVRATGTGSQALALLAVLIGVALASGATWRDLTRARGLRAGSAVASCTAAYTLWDAFAVAELHVAGVPYMALSSLAQLVLLTIVLGIAGALLASWFGRYMGWYHAGEPAGFLGALLGAIAILALLRLQPERYAALLASTPDNARLLDTLRQRA